MSYDIGRKMLQVWVLYSFAKISRQYVRKAKLACQGPRMLNRRRLALRCTWAA